MGQRSGIRSLVQDTGIYALATASGPLAALFAVPVVSRELGPERFGTVELLLTLTALSGMVAMMGLDTAAARSFFERDLPDARRSSVVSTAVATVAASSLTMAILIAAGVLLLRAVGVDIALGAVLLALLTVPLIAVQAMIREGFRLEGRRGWYVTMSASGAALGAVAAVILVAFAGGGPAGYFLGLSFGALAALVVGIAGNHRMLRAPLDRAELSVMLRFGLPLIPASVSVWALLLADRGVLGALRGAEEVGLYGIGARVATPLFFAVQAFQIAWIPFALRLARDDPAGEPATRSRVTTLVLAATVSGGLALTAFADTFAELLGGRSFAEAGAAVLPLCLAWVAYGISAVGIIPLSIARRSNVVAKVTAACAAVGILLAFVLVPRFGFEGAAWSTAAAYCLLAGLMTGAGQRISPTRLDIPALAVILALGAAGLAAESVLPEGGVGFVGRAVVWVCTSGGLALVVLLRVRAR